MFLSSDFTKEMKNEDGYEEDRGVYCRISPVEFHIIQNQSQYFSSNLSSGHLIPSNLVQSPLATERRRKMMRANSYWILI
jgi:hypothetical protein